MERVHIGVQARLGDANAVLAAHKGDAPVPQRGQVAHRRKHAPAGFALDEQALHPGDAAAQHHHGHRGRQVLQRRPIGLAYLQKVRLAAHDQHPVDLFVQHHLEIFQFPGGLVGHAGGAEGGVAQKDRIVGLVGGGLELAEHGREIGVGNVWHDDADGHALPVDQAAGKGVWGVAVPLDDLVYPPAGLFRHRRGAVHDPRNGGDGNAALFGDLHDRDRLLHGVASRKRNNAPLV